MIRFQQKVFFWQAALAGGSLLSKAANVGFIGSSLFGIKNGRDQQKELERQGEAQRDAAEKQQELIKEQNRKLEKISDEVKSNPSAVGQIGDAISQNQQPEVGKYYSMINERSYSAVEPLLAGAKKYIGKLGQSKFVTNAKGFGKDILNYTNSASKQQLKSGALVDKSGAAPRRQVLIGNLMAGTTVGVAGYGVNKAIQADRKAHGFNDKQTQQAPAQANYSAVGNVLKSSNILGKAKALAKESWKSNKGSVAIGGVFGALPAIGYLTERKQLNDQAKLSGTTATNNAQQKNYSVLSGISKGFATFRKHKLDTVLGGANKFMSFGAIGRREVGDFANTMAKSKNTWSSKLGNAMLAKDAAGKVLKDEAGNVMANKKALAGSLAVSTGLVGGAWSQSEKAVNKLGHKIDPNAYAYQDNKEKQIQQ